MLPLFFRVKIRKGAIQMLKKIISAMLALTLALSPGWCGLCFRRAGARD